MSVTFRLAFCAAIAAASLGAWFFVAPVLSQEPAAAKEPVTAEDSAAVQDSAASESFYLRQVRPILQTRCVKCHGPDEQQSGLRLDTAARALNGGDSGPAVLPGKPDESYLLLAVSGSDLLTKMPNEGPPLTDAQIAVLRQWIEQGAVAPDDESNPAAASDHWSFRPPIAYVPPDVDPSIQSTDDSAARPNNGIDSFVLGRLGSEEIAPSPEADRTTLIRRLSLDLLGLPPSIEEIDEFLADQRPDAYERLVDRLFASPALGERWGRHWLDVARYADSHGYTRDFAREIWPYRDWVIAAWNRDLPFDQFTIDQIAGDMLPDATLDQQVATGFHRNTLINEEGGTDAEQFRVEAVADRVATTGSAFLGLTLGCARCHDHKFDPISHADFYRMFALLNNCEEPEIEVPSQWQVRTGALEQRAEIRRRIDEMQKELEARRPEFEAKQREWEKSVTPEQRSRLPGPVQVAFDMPFDERDPANKKRLEEHYKRTEHARAAFPLLEEISRQRGTEPKIASTMAMRERSQPRETYVHRRGNFLDHGQRVVGGVPAVLPQLAPGDEPADRLDLARWLVDAENPLTPRVVVNRWWQKLFGSGLVETEDDFGLMGTPPTHPELLDWLAVELVRREWSAKSTLRLIVTSATYRQSSHARPDLETIDPQNKLLARQSRLRVEAEIVRDAALAASGLLTRTIGGPSVYPPQPDGVFDFTQDPKPWRTEKGADRYRRGMYTFFWRSSPYPAQAVFDAPGGNVTCTRRLRSNTPLQALTLANDEVFVEAAQQFAQRVLSEAPAADDAARVRYAFRLSLGREPSAAELERLQRFVSQQRDVLASAATNASQDNGASGGEVSTNTETDTEHAAWTALCRVLLNLDEFITRE